MDTRKRNSYEGALSKEISIYREKYLFNYNTNTPMVAVALGRPEDRAEP